MKKILFIIILISISCSNKSHHTENSIHENVAVPDDLSRDSILTTEDHNSRDLERELFINKKKSSNTSKTTDYDNMRGFDPASEDDMDDNGMSRYMENNDEEGWD